MHDQLTVQHGQLPRQPVRALPPLEAGGPLLRFGFTYKHVEALAWKAVWSHASSWGKDREDRFEAAWGAVVEHLYSAEVPPSVLDLLRAGEKGLDAQREEYLRELGFPYRKTGGSHDPLAGAGSSRPFCRYWNVPAPPGPEELATERTALVQVTGALAPADAAALLALAEHGTLQDAATALGMPYAAFTRRVRIARSAFLALWHEHEAPSRIWRRELPPRLAPRTEAAGDADAAAVMAVIAEAFRGQARAASAVLLVRLSAADPARFGDWKPVDLARFLRRHAVPRHGIEVRDGGRVFSRSGYWLEEVTAALEDMSTHVTQDTQSQSRAA